MRSLDLWDGAAITGAALLGGGIWRVWGAPWACMLWGVLLLGVAAVHAWRFGGAR